MRRRFSSRSADDNRDAGVQKNRGLIPLVIVPLGSNRMN